MGHADIAMTIYLILLVSSLLISYLFGSYMIKSTGLFISHAFIAGAMNITLGLVIITGWAFYTWGINEILFLGGILLGAGVLITSEIVLIVLLYIRRKQWLH